MVMRWRLVPAVQSERNGRHLYCFTLVPITQRWLLFPDIPDTQMKVLSDLDPLA
jgi:hypothetical protein